MPDPPMLLECEIIIIYCHHIVIIVSIPPTIHSWICTGYMCAAVPEIAHIRKTGQAATAALAPAEEGVYSGTVLLLLLWLFVPASSPCNYGSALEL